VSVEDDMLALWGQPDATLPRPDLSPLEPRLRRAEQKLEAIQHLSQLNAATTDRDGLVAEITRRIASLIDCERATLWLVEPTFESGADDADNYAKPDPRLCLIAQLATATHADLPTHAEPVVIPLGRGLAGWVAEHNRPINVKDAYKDPRFDPCIDELTGFRTSSVACLPLVDPHSRAAHLGVFRARAPSSTRQGVLGVIQALNKRDGYFSPGDEELLRACAEQSAILLRQQRLFSDLATQNIELFDLKLRLQERTAEVELMFDVERAAAVARDLDEALDGALKRTLTELPCELATVILLDRGDARTSFTVRRSAGPGAAKLPPQVLGLDRLVVDTAVHNRVVSRSEWDHGNPNVDAVFSTLLGRLEAREFASIPIARPGEPPLGALLLVNPTDMPRVFDEHHLHKLSVIASRIALSVVLATIMEEERKAERLAAIGGALSSVVHDLRTPLTLLSGYARLLEREEDPDKRHELRALHKRQVEQLQVMIKEILAFAKGKQDLFLRKVWVRELLSDLEELLRAEPPENATDAAVTLVIDPAYKGAVKADEAKLKRALLNLAKNAREAMAKTGGTLTVAAAESDGKVVFTVSDTGPGIAPEMEGRLFQSFATHGKDSGTGLGLAIVKTIVEQHEGTLDVTTGPAGTTFSIALSPL
jgi:signal transduction histidine kinase